jgi:3-dehydroquinate synthase
MVDLQMFDDFKVSSKIVGAYSVKFVEDLSKQLLSMAENPNVIFIVDEKVIHLFIQNFDVIIPSARIVRIESNEQNKTINYCQEVIRDLIKLKVRKDDRLVAVGGGITQDIVAFISSIIFRGVEWEFLPTTLLAQCDSCIGSKSSINFDSFKNLLGTFNPPSNIYIYKGFLNTLTESEIRSGIGEMLHYYFTEGIELADEITSRISELLIDRSKLGYFIKNSLRIKKEIIEIDEFDQSIRHIFNYGHTFGHALEAITNYTIPHGHAITLGMDLANYISLQLGFINSKQFDQMHLILLRNMPSFEFTKANISNYINALLKDKKNKANKIGCILTKGIGKVEKHYIDNDVWLRQTILAYSESYKLV